MSHAKLFEDHYDLLKRLNFLDLEVESAERRGYDRSEVRGQNEDEHAEINRKIEANFKSVEHDYPEVKRSLQFLAIELRASFRDGNCARLPEYFDDYIAQRHGDLYFRTLGLVELERVAGLEPILVLARIKLNFSTTTMADGRVIAAPDGPGGMANIVRVMNEQEERGLVVMISQTDAYSYGFFDPDKWRQMPETSEIIHCIHTGNDAGLVVFRMDEKGNLEVQARGTIHYIPASGLVVKAIVPG